MFVSATTPPLSEVAEPWRWAFEEAWASWIAGSLGIEPREEWLRANLGSWRAALDLVGDGTLSALAARRATVDEMIASIGPVLLRHGAT